MRPASATVSAWISWLEWHGGMAFSGAAQWGGAAVLVQRRAGCVHVLHSAGCGLLRAGCWVLRLCADDALGSAPRTPGICVLGAGCCVGGAGNAAAWC
jgi:hypothetical protein